MIQTNETNNSRPHSQQMIGFCFRWHSCNRHNDTLPARRWTQCRSIAKTAGAEFGERSIYVCRQNRNLFASCDCDTLQLHGNVVPFKKNTAVYIDPDRSGEFDNVIIDASNFFILFSVCSAADHFHDMRQYDNNECSAAALVAAPAVPPAAEHNANKNDLIKFLSAKLNLIFAMKWKWKGVFFIIVFRLHSHTVCTEKSKSCHSIRCVPKHLRLSSHIQHTHARTHARLHLHIHLR